MGGCRTDPPPPVGSREKAAGGCPTALGWWMLAKGSWPHLRAAKQHPRLLHGAPVPKRTPSLKAVGPVGGKAEHHQPAWATSLQGLYQSLSFSTRYWARAAGGGELAPSASPPTPHPPQSAAPTSGWWHRLYQQSPAPSPVDPLGPHTKLAFFWFWKSLSQMACQINVHTRLQK